MPIDIDVLIVGAGPVGLFLANECARRGLRWRLVEAKLAQSEHSKALAVMPRTFEILDMAGLARPFQDANHPVTWVAVTSREREISRMRFAPEESPYPYVAMIPQDVTERLLASALTRRDGVVEYGTTCVSAVERDDHVVVTVERNSQPLTITAAFVVGCDGAHSTIRHHLNLTFEGGAYDATYMLADAETNETLAADEMQLCPSEFGPFAIFPMSATRRRLLATVDGAPAEGAPTLEDVRKVIAQRAPVGLEAKSIHWSTYFHIHHRMVERMRVGRVFVAGDAAHIHSPFGGQGMNTGIQDAWNLAWKLDLVVRGLAGEHLLDSYNAERHPVIRQVIDLTHLMTQAMGTPSKLAQMVRDVMIPVVWRLSPFQHAFVERLSELGIAYRGSPIIDGHGERYFDDTLRGGRGIASRFLLMVGPDVDAVTTEGAKELAASLAKIVEMRPSQRPGITLLRPDGYVAYAGNAIAPVRSVLERNLS
jgi:2-polyprenyl-6-methoxyphenol hydroxylase-like FAD-dependent oxidoreductase